MNEEAIKLLYEDIKDSYDVGSLDEFKNYLLDDNKRKMFFDQVIKPKYDVNTIDDFESVYGLKKKTNYSLLLKRKVRYPLPRKKVNLYHRNIQKSLISSNLKNKHQYLLLLN